MSWPSIASALRRQISEFHTWLSLRATRSNLPPAMLNHDGDCFVTPLLAMTKGERRGYLFMFQMSVASCHWPPIFRHTTTYLPVTCSGGCAFVLKLNVPISRAAPGPSDCTSRSEEHTSELQSHSFIS